VKWLNVRLKKSALSALKTAMKPARKISSVKLKREKNKWSSKSKRTKNRLESGQLIARTILMRRREYKKKLRSSTTIPLRYCASR